MQTPIIKIGSKIILETSEKITLERVIRDNTFKNQKFHSEYNYNQKEAEYIKIYGYDNDGRLILPRGYMRNLLQIFQELNIPRKVIDERISVPVIYPEKLSRISLRPYQQRAVEKALKYDQGVVCAPTGSGKTLISLEILRKRREKALIILHRNELAKQWLDKIKECLGFVAGFIGDGQWTIGNEITVAMAQTLFSKEEETKSLSNAFGAILIDECHHSPADSFINVINQFSSKYRYGVSATPQRSDGFEEIIYRAIGPCIANISRSEVEGVGATVPAFIKVTETGYSPGTLSNWNDFIDSLTESPDRNRLIIELASKADSPVLILTDRVLHAEFLSEMLTRRNLDHVLAHGQVKGRDELIEKIKNSWVTVATSALIGEGIDVSCWGTLILTMPVSSEIKLLQAIGRVIRSAPGKEIALVYDLKDDCGFSGASFKKRLNIYRKNNIRVELDKNKKTALGKRAA